MIIITKWHFCLTNRLYFENTSERFTSFCWPYSPLQPIPACSPVSRESMWTTLLLDKPGGKLSHGSSRSHNQRILWGHLEENTMPWHLSCFCLGSQLMYTKYSRCQLHSSNWPGEFRKKKNIVITYALVSQINTTTIHMYSGFRI